MQPQSDQLSPNGAPRCVACHDVIGVYEPMVQVFDELARLTSRAAEPRIECSGSRCYHLGCYRALEACGSTPASAPTDGLSTV